MKKFLSCTRTVLILALVTVMTLGCYAYMLARPISYGMGYHNATAYGDDMFEGTMKFLSDGTMLNSNTNFDMELVSRYYFQDGYVFYTMAETDEAFAEEVAYITENFDEAIHAPFYADEINAFRLVAAEADGYSTVYTCKSAVILAVVGGVVELALIGLLCGCVILRRKSGV